jgi:hypothetical protein
LKELDGTVKFNAEAITDLPDALKSIINKAQEGFQDVAAKLAWNNKQNEAASILRHLEFEIVNFGLSISELQDAFQFVLMGKFPLNLISPNMLRETLRNVSTILPNGYEFVMGLQANKLVMYYDVVTDTVLADFSSFKLILHVPLKSYNRYFELYR